MLCFYNAAAAQDYHGESQPWDCQHWLWHVWSTLLWGAFIWGELPDQFTTCLIALMRTDGQGHRVLASRPAIHIARALICCCHQCQILMLMAWVVNGHVLAPYKALYRLQCNGNMPREAMNTSRVGTLAQRSGNEFWLSITLLSNVNFFISSLNLLKIFYVHGLSDLQY